MSAPTAAPTSPGDRGPEKLLKPAEVAEILDVPVSWVYYAARTQMIPVVNLGRYRRFRREDIETYIEVGGTTRPW